MQGAVQGLMRKMLLQLVAEMRKLGAIVVAADFSSVIIATGKHNLTAAVGCASHTAQHCDTTLCSSLLPARYCRNSQRIDIFCSGSQIDQLSQSPQTDHQVCLR